MPRSACQDRQHHNVLEWPTKGNPDARRNRRAACFICGHAHPTRRIQGTGTPESIVACTDLRVQAAHPARDPISAHGHKKERMINPNAPQSSGAF